MINVRRVPEIDVGDIVAAGRSPGHLARRYRAIALRAEVLPADMRAPGAIAMVRKDFTPSEKVAIADAIADLERAEAKERQTAGGVKGGKTKQATSLPSRGASYTTPSRAKDRARAHVATRVGVSARTLGKAREVVEAARREPRSTVRSRTRWIGRGEWIRSELRRPTPAPPAPDQ